MQIHVHVLTRMSPETGTEEEYLHYGDAKFLDSFCLNTSFNFSKSPAERVDRSSIEQLIGLALYPHVQNG